MAELKQEILWKEMINNPRVRSFTARIMKEGAIILKAAIYICENKEIRKFGLSKERLGYIGRTLGLDEDALEFAEGMANKIRQFHAEGLAIKEFRDLMKLIKRYGGKMPLVKAHGRAEFEMFVHETIHYVLAKNGIAAQEIIGPAGERFDEGICTYLHLRFRWSRAWYSHMYLWDRRGARYRRMSRYFKAKLQVQDRKIGPLLKKNQKAYALEMAKMYRK